MKYLDLFIKNLPIYLSLLLVLTCAKEDNTSLIEGYQLQISQLNSKITEYSNQVTQLQSTVNSLNSQVNTIPGLEDTITSLNEQIGELEETIESLTSEVSTIPDLNDEITSLEETIASLNEQIESLELILNPPETSIEVVNSQFTVNTTIIEFEDLYRSLGGLRNSVYYTQNSNEYILFAGSSLPSITGKLHGTPTSLKKNQEGVWELHTPIGWTNIGMGGIRNTYQINPNTFLFADAAEQPLNGTGIVREENHIYIAEANGDNVNWTKIENDGYHHDASFGDLNNDGLLDILSASQGEIYYGTGGYNFDIVFDKLPSRYGSAYFSNEIVDVDNDGIEEIIEVSYVGSTEDVKNGFRVLKRNDNGNYDLFKKITNTKLNSNDDMGGTWVESLDLNNDGNKDLIILREGYVGGEPISGVLEIYFGDGQGNFSSNQLFIGDELGVSFVSPNLMDIDNDADLDIVFTSACMGGNCNDFPGLIPTGKRKDGWRLDNLIFINDGSGNYNKYNKELKGPTGTFPKQFIPFINKDGNLSFYGTHVWDNQDQSALVNIWEVTINNL